MLGRCWEIFGRCWEMLSHLKSLGPVISSLGPIFLLNWADFFDPRDSFGQGILKGLSENTASFLQSNHGINIQQLWNIYLYWSPSNGGCNSRWQVFNYNWCTFTAENGEKCRDFPQKSNNATASKFAHPPGRRPRKIICGANEFSWPSARGVGI